MLKLKNQEELSLKIFIKDIKNESLFTGYFNKIKKIHYYKSRGTSTKVNINANKLNNQFASLLSSFEFDVKLNDKLYDILHKKLTAQLENNKVDETANKKRISELNRQIELLEKRYVLKEITAELYAKFSQKYQSEID